MVPWQVRTALFVPVSWTKIGWYRKEDPVPPGRLARSSSPGPTDSTPRHQPWPGHPTTWHPDPDRRRSRRLEIPGSTDSPSSIFRYAFFMRLTSGAIPLSVWMRGGKVAWASCLIGSVWMRCARRLGHVPAHLDRPRVALRQRPPPHRARLRIRRAVRHVQPLPADGGQQGADGAAAPTSTARPIQVQADKEGVTARELADRYNRVIVEDLPALGLSYDLFTRTTTRQPLRRRAGDLQGSLRQRLHLPARPRWARSRRPPAAPCPTATSRAPARSAATTAPAATSATTAATSSTRSS